MFSESYEIFGEQGRFYRSDKGRMQGKIYLVILVTGGRRTGAYVFQCKKAPENSEAFEFPVMRSIDLAQAEMDSPDFAGVGCSVCSPDGAGVPAA